jgi:hypothetical protein
MSSSTQNRIWSIGLILTLLVLLVPLGIGQSGVGATAFSDQIQFVTSVNMHTAGDVTGVSVTLQNQLNDTLVVTTGSDTGNITTISDTFNDTFIQRVHVCIAPNPCNSLEVWTTRTAGAGANIISLTTDALVIVATVVGVYRNVNAIGNATATTGAGQPSLTMLTAKSGSWVTGEILTSSIACPATVTASTQFLDRNQVCTANLGVLDLEDNATVVRNNLLMTFAPTNPATSFAVSMVELVAVDQSPQNPAFSTFCSTTNGLCVTSQYKLNVAGVSTRPTGNTALAPSTAYCTGITSTGLTTTNNDNVEGWATFGGNDRNITVATMLVQLFITTTAPSTVFGVGQCSASQTIIGSMTINAFPTQGTGAPNAYGGAINGYTALGLASGTWYAYIEITPYNFAGHMLWLDSPAQAYEFASVTIMEIK